MRGGRISVESIDPLGATQYKEPPLVGFSESYAIRTSNTKANGNGVSKEISHTIKCDGPEVVDYRIDPISSNSMKSGNPNSGIHEENICHTLDGTVPTPMKNQGGMLIMAKR